jgi:hypothetical protein
MTLESRVSRLEERAPPRPLRVIRDDGSVDVEAEEAKLAALGFEVLIIRHIIVDPDGTRWLYRPNGQDIPLPRVETWLE